jgi:hypothetical protein
MEINESRKTRKHRDRERERALSHVYIYKDTFSLVQFLEIYCLKILLRLKSGCSDLVLKHLAVNTNFTAV